MVDGVNISVEAHRRLPEGGEQCDSTNVAAGICEHHSASTGVLFSGSSLHIHPHIRISLFSRPRMVDMARLKTASEVAGLETQC